MKDWKGYQDKVIIHLLFIISFSFQISAISKVFQKDFKTHSYPYFSRDLERKGIKRVAPP
jgi:hypothetical protein